MCGKTSDGVWAGTKTAFIRRLRGSGCWRSSFGTIWISLTGWAFGNDLLGTLWLFTAIGNGAGRSDLVARCQGLPNVRFLDLQHADRLPDLLATAGIALTGQKKCLKT